MKICRECNTEKPLLGFYKHAAMADGHLNKCIQCVKSRIKKHREVNLEKIKAYDKSRANSPHRVQARKEYSTTENGKQAKQKANASYRERYPLKYAAHVITRNHIRDGRLKAETACLTCKSTKKVEAHHDDYTKPLEVRWLCESCHKDWHRHNKAIYE